jgi:hypothetical protein
MNDETESLRIVTHYQVDGIERRGMDRGLTERAHYRNRPSYMQRRTWSNSTADKEARHGKFKFNVPQWLLPKNGVHVFNTITASIVWGLCGRMADVPEYGDS